MSYTFSVIVSVLQSLSPFVQSSKRPSPLIPVLLSVSRSEPESSILNTEPIMCTALQLELHVVSNNSAGAGAAACANPILYYTMDIRIARV